MNQHPTFLNNLYPRARLATVLVLGGLMLALQATIAPAVAQVSGTDDFNDDNKDATKWGSDLVDGGGQLTETNQRLEFTLGAVPPQGYAEVERPWTLGTASPDEDWVVEFDVHNSSVPVAADEVTSVGIEILKASNLDYVIWGELYASTWGGPPLRRGFNSTMVTGDGGELWGDSGDLGAVNGRVRLSYNSSTRVITCSYDLDPSDGYQWQVLASFGVGGSGGSDGNADWMMDNDSFLIAVYGFAEGMPVNSGEMYGDNFFVQATPGLSLWEVCGAVVLGSDWYWLNWFGTFNLTFDPWVYHLQHRFLYPFGANCAGLVFWDNEMETFWWTSASVYPYVYRFSDGQWLWFQPTSGLDGNPRWFVILSSGLWERYPPPPGP